MTTDIILRQFQTNNYERYKSGIIEPHPGTEPKGLSPRYIELRRLSTSMVAVR